MHFVLPYNICQHHKRSIPYRKGDDRFAFKNLIHHGKMWRQD